MLRAVLSAPVAAWELAVALVVAGPSPPSGGDLPAWIWPVVAAVGSFVMTVVSGKVVVPTWAYNHEKARADRWEAEAMRLNQAIADKLVPAVDAATHAMEESSGTVKEALAVIRKRPRA